MSKKLQIGGFVPFTTIDFPGLSSAVVFCRGCPWRCSYCQNKELQAFVSADELSLSGPGTKKTNSALDWNGVLAKIFERRNFLEGVVFSGGEPLAQEEIADAINAVKSLGLKVGLHTSGAYPQTLQTLEKIDWVGLDIKTSFDKYDALTGVKDSGIATQQSLDVLLNKSIDFECRTTVDPAYVSPEQVLEIARYLRKKGVKTYKLQRCFDDDRAPLYSPCFDDEFTKKLDTIML
ncbi:MAG: anaerobic ribonucleoside-triphosphate reductase activating protein [Holosporales bacterium]|jgi:pyruvate formate lyase activating enzyme|nr:anaerobic ribonucleoside-triphosphate reductase activating protein [Holosporales bacterium]